jgi:hypothetical protein
MLSFLRIVFYALAPAALAMGAASSISSVNAKESRTKPVAESGQVGNRMSAMVVRIWKDGRECPTGRARLRPYRDGELDASRYVEVGRFSYAEGLEDFPRLLGHMMTLDISKLREDVTAKPLRESLIPIAPGRYVLTWITCRHGNSAEWVGVDRPIFLFKETGRMAPVKGANMIDVRPGEVIDAGVLEIRSDEVGLFEAKTASVIAQPAPPHEREVLRGVASKVRFTTFATGGLNP